MCDSAQVLDRHSRYELDMKDHDDQQRGRISGDYGSFLYCGLYERLTNHDHKSTVARETNVKVFTEQRRMYSNSSPDTHNYIARSEIRILLRPVRMDYVGLSLTEGCLGRTEQYREAVLVEIVKSRVSSALGIIYVGSWYQVIDAAEII